MFYSLHCFNSGSPFKYKNGWSERYNPSLELSSFYIGQRRLNLPISKLLPSVTHKKHPNFIQFLFKHKIKLRQFTLIVLYSMLIILHKLLLTLANHASPVVYNPVHKPAPQQNNLPAGLIPSPSHCNLTQSFSRHQYLHGVLHQYGLADFAY